MENISSGVYNTDEIAVRDSIRREVEFMEDVPEGFNAKNWKIEIEFLNENNYRIESFGDGKED